LFKNYFNLILLLKSSIPTYFVLQDSNQFNFSTEIQIKNDTNITPILRGPNSIYNNSPRFINLIKVDNHQIIKKNEIKRHLTTPSLNKSNHIDIKRLKACVEANRRNINAATSNINSSIIDKYKKTTFKSITVEKGKLNRIHLD
jgi:hypothetical protein